MKTSLASNTDPLKDAATPDEDDVLDTAVEGDVDGNKSGDDTTDAREAAAAALNAFVMRRGEAGPRSFLGVDGDFRAAASSSIPFQSSLPPATGDLEKSTGQSHVHYPPASPEPNDYKLLKFYSVTGPTLRSLLNRSGKSDASLPFKVTSKEWAILQLDIPRAILLLGRSGTGKTSCICYRLAHKWSQYWESERNLFATPPDVLDWRQAHQQQIISTLSNQPGGGIRAENKQREREAEGSESTITLSTVDASCHLRQIFLTKNPVLRGQVEDVTRSLCQAFSAKSNNPMETSSQEHGAFAGENGDDSSGRNIGIGQKESTSAECKQLKGAHGIGQLQAVPDERFPLFLTGFELLCTLDASLPGERFQESKLGGKSQIHDGRGSSHNDFNPYLGVDEQEHAALVDLDDYFSGANDTDDLDEGNDGDDDDVNVEGDTSTRASENLMGAGATAAGSNHSSLSTAREITFQVFVKQLWPKMKPRNTSTPAASNGNSNSNNSQSTLEPALVWTEIKSYIKGSVEFLKAHMQADTEKESVLQRQAQIKKAYLGLGRKRVSMDAAVRDRVKNKSR